MFVLICCQLGKLLKNNVLTKLMNKYCHRIKQTCKNLWNNFTNWESSHSIFSYFNKFNFWFACSTKSLKSFILKGILKIADPQEPIHWDFEVRFLVHCIIICVITVTMSCPFKCNVCSFRLWNVSIYSCCSSTVNKYFENIKIGLVLLTNLSFS